MPIHVHSPRRLLESLCALPRETGWVEFKENKFNEDSVGQYVSSLANSAMFDGRDAAYLVFGVSNEDHEVVGTSVDLLGETVGNESFILWLNKYLDPHISVNVQSFDYDGKRVEILCIDPGYRQPVKFKKIPYVRIGTSQQPLSNYPERERTLWQITSRYSFESSFLTEHVTPAQIDELFAYSHLLRALGHKFDQPKAAFDHMVGAGWIKTDLQGRYEVTALLAMAASYDLNHFPALLDKGTRVLAYKGKDKLDAISDTEGNKGHLVTFVSLLDVVMSKIPSKELMRHGVRTTVFDVPELSVREFLANMLVHQDFTQTGTRPTVEVFKDKIRFTNPGEPLISVDRFIDAPSKTRNPKFAKLMRDAGFCEQRGSGVDRAIREIEKAALPPPLIESIEGSTVVTVFMPRKFAEMTSEERVRACFQHACLGYEHGEPMSNASLRSRFGLTDRQYPQVSLVIKEAIDAGRIRPQSEDQGNRNARYVPFYAKDL